MGALTAQWGQSKAATVADPHEELYVAAERGDLSAVQTILNAGASIDRKDWVTHNQTKAD